MGNVVRIGDNVSCGDHSAKGSGNVFANNQPITHKGANKTTGHPGGVPSLFEGPWSNTVFINNQPVALKGITKIVIHNKKSLHTGHPGVASSGSPNVSIED